MEGGAIPSLSRGGMEREEDALHNGASFAPFMVTPRSKGVEMTLTLTLRDRRLRFVMPIRSAVSA